MEYAFLYHSSLISLHRDYSSGSRFAFHTQNNSQCVAVSRLVPHLSMKWVNVPCSTALDASFICENETTPVTGSFQTVQQNILTCPPNWMLCNDTCILLIEECIPVILDNKCLQEVRWLPPDTHRVPCSNGSWYTGISAWRSTYVPSYIEQEQVVCEQDPGILDMVCLASQFKCQNKDLYSRHLQM